MNIDEIVALNRLIPEITVTELSQAVPLARAMVAGGLRVLAINLKTPVAIAAIEAIRRDVPEAIVGAGELTRAVDFAAAGRAGAHFGASPGFTPELAAASRGARFPLLPGVMTPSELIAARSAGFNVLQLYPAHQAGGVAMLQRLGEVFADIAFCPAGGVTRTTAADYLPLANVICVVGSWIAPKPMVAAGDWAGIQSLARDAALLAKR